jgi:Glyoxalase/Bleomycin resistance protein/Dioxygenase superfamily
MRVERPYNGTIRFHHIGVITQYLEDSIVLYSGIGYSSSDMYHDPIQKARIVLMRRNHEPVIELVSPQSPDSPAASWVRRIGAGPYHTCYEVDDMESAAAFFRSTRHFPVLGPVPAVAFDMRQILFLWSNATGLIELIESGEPRV